MEKVLEICKDDVLRNNLFSLNKDDKLYQYKVDNELVGYGIFRNNEYDMIQIFILDKYQNRYYGTELFKKMIELISKKIYVSTKADNFKMIKIILNSGGKELGRNNGIITYEIVKDIE